MIREDTRRHRVNETAGHTCISPYDYHLQYLRLPHTNTALKSCWRARPCCGGFWPETLSIYPNRSFTGCRKFQCSRPWHPFELFRTRDAKNVIIIDRNICGVPCYGNLRIAGIVASATEGDNRYHKRHVNDGFRWKLHHSAWIFLKVVDHAADARWRR